MKRIGDASFFRIVDRLLTVDPRRPTAANWSIDGIDWRRERHSYSGAGHGFSLEVTRGTKPGSNGWTLMYVKEYWRDSSGNDAKAMQWAHLEKGSRSDVLAWLKRQEHRLETP